MKITMLTGSPHKKGTTALLADQFALGAMEKGHEIVRFEAAFKKVSGCRACNYCVSHPGECVQKDDMTGLYPILVESDVIVFVTPLYYHNMTSQLKAVIDRFYPVNDALMQGKKGAVLLSACIAPVPAVMDGLVKSHMDTLRFLKWEDRGILLAPGMGTREDIEKTDYPQRAYEMGYSLS